MEDKKLIEDALYLKEKVEKARNDEVNVANINKLSRYFGFTVVKGSEDKCYNGVLNGNVIVLNQDYSSEGRLIYFGILLGHSLIYLKDNPLTYDCVYYTKKTDINPIYLKLYKDFTADLLLGQNNLDLYFKNGKKVK